jgi:hypothetical protein
MGHQQIDLFEEKMMALKKLTKFVALITAATSMITNTFAFSFRSADFDLESNFHKAFYFTPERSNYFELDATDPANLRLSREDLREIIRADVDKTMKLFANSKWADKGTRRDVDSITNKIMWAAECTGNDPIVLASIIGNESSYCFFTESLSGGGDSGCGQFTGTAISSLKKATGNASEEVYRQVTEPVQEMAEQCAKGSSFVEPKTFKNFFAKSTADIKKDLVNGKNLSLDIMSTAIFLKILYASTGGVYYDNGSKKRAIWRYNGGGVKNYTQHVYIDKACVLNPDMAYCPTEI